MRESRSAVLEAHAALWGAGRGSIMISGTLLVSVDSLCISILHTELLVCR